MSVTAWVIRSASWLFCSSDFPGQSLTITCGIAGSYCSVQPQGGGSHDRHPAVHGEGVADDVARPRAAQPQHGRRDLLGPARPADGDVLRDLGVGLLVSGYDVAGDLRVDE